MKAWLDDFFDDFSVVVEELSNMSAVAVNDGEEAAMAQGKEEAVKEEAGKEEAGKGETRTRETRTRETKKEIVKNITIKLQTQNSVVPPASMYEALEQFLLYIQIYSNSCSGHWTFSIAENLLKLLRKKRKKRKKKRTMVVERRNRDDDSDPRVASSRVASSRVASRMKEASKQVTIDTSLVTSMLPPPPSSIVPPGGLHPGKKF